MGTSKGYIPPTTLHWKESKRAVTSYINCMDYESREKAIRKFAEAMRSDIAASAEFVNAAGSVIAFANLVATDGFNNALHNYGRDDLIGKSSSEIYSALLQEFTNYGSTTEGYLSYVSISGALEALGISDLEQLKDLDPTILLKEIIIEYVKNCFAFRYEEKILERKTPDETDRILSEMNEYISNELHTKLVIDDIMRDDFTRMDSLDVVKKCLESAYRVFMIFYGDE